MLCGGEEGVIAGQCRAEGFKIFLGSLGRDSVDEESHSEAQWESNNYAL